MNLSAFIIDCYGKLYNRKYLPAYLLSPLRFVVRRLANRLLPFSFKLKDSNRNNSIAIEEKIVVSLTSYPARIEKVWIVIESLKRQTVKAKQIVLWLSKEQFPDLFNNIPDSLKNEIDDVFTIRFVDGDIRSHKKYYYVFQECPDSLVILVDDDIIYSSTLIEELYSNHKLHPHSIICRYGLIMKYNQDGSLKSYLDWGKDYDCLSTPFFFGSGGGTLFEPMLMTKDIFRRDVFMKLTPLADDIWLNAMADLSKLQVKVISKKLLLPVISKDDNPLTKINVYENKNDQQINNVVNYYKSKGVDVFRSNN